MIPSSMCRNIGFSKSLAQIEAAIVQIIYEVISRLNCVGNMCGWHGMVDTSISKSWQTIMRVAMKFSFGFEHLLCSYYGATHDMAISLSNRKHYFECWQYACWETVNFSFSLFFWSNTSNEYYKNGASEEVVLYFAFFLPIHVRISLCNTLSI